MAKWNNGLIQVALDAAHKAQGAWFDPRRGGGDW